MSEAQAGTPEPAKDDSQQAGTPEAAKDDSGLNAQQQKEWMTLKEKAQKFNQMEADLAAEKARREELERLAYSGGARQATDPRAELVSQLQEQARYDPVAAATLMNMRDSLETKAEVWLSNELLRVPENKRTRVAALIRNSGFQMDASGALNVLEDPEAKTLAEQLAEMKAEVDRLKGAKANGASPAAVNPANASSDASRMTEIKRSEYTAILRAGGPRATELMKAVGSNETKLVPD